jgi:hypothetical protein
MVLPNTVGHAAQALDQYLMSQAGCEYDVLRSDYGTVFCYADLRLREFARARVWRHLLLRDSPDKMGTAVEQLQIVYDSRIVWLKLRRL